MFCTSTIHLVGGKATIGWQVHLHETATKPPATVQILACQGKEEALIEEKPLVRPGERWTGQLLTERAEQYALNAYYNIFSHL